MCNTDKFHDVEPALRTLDQRQKTLIPLDAASQLSLSQTRI
jgi:hypothetical protein